MIEYSLFPVWRDVSDDGMFSYLTKAFIDLNSTFLISIDTDKTLSS